MTELPTRIIAAVIYPDRGRVTRQGIVRLEQGHHTLQAADLPLTLDPDSLRVAARGSARARLLGVQIQRVYYADTPAEAVRQLEAQVEAIQDEIQRADRRAETLKHHRTLLDLVSGHTETYATALAANETSLEQQLALFDGLRARAEQLDDQLQSLAVERRNLERRLKKLQGELEQKRSARPRERYTALVEVDVLQEGELIVELSYVVSGARWKPLYDLRLQEDGDRATLEVTYLAQVTQQTGDDWEGVQLTLSTARPALAGRLPELEAWYIQPFQLPPPTPKLGARAASIGPADAPESAAAVPAQEAFTKIEAAPARLDSSAAAVSYVIPAEATIPADGAPHKVTIARFALTPQLDYVSAPKLVAAAYRRAKAVNDSPYVLLPGAANLFAGEDFLGATSLELIAPQGEIELYLGVDDRIKIERELKRREVDKTLMGGKRRTRFGYEISVENWLPTDACLTLRDHIPVSKDENIKVKLENAEPKPSEQSELNLLDWTLTLSPKEKRSVRFDFSVEAPPEMNVAGLP